VTLAFDILTPKINGFPRLIVEHLFVKFGDPSCIDFLRYRAEKQTQTNSGKKATAPTAVDVGNKSISCILKLDLHSNKSSDNGSYVSFYAE